MNLPTKPLTWNTGLLSGVKHAFALQKRKRRRTVWQRATPEEYQWLKTQPQIEELGDFLFLAPAIEDELWLLVERTWHGFPDPPLYAFLAFDLEGKLIAGGDLDHLPRTWTLPKPQTL